MNQKINVKLVPLIIQEIIMVYVKKKNVLLQSVMFVQSMINVKNVKKVHIIFKIKKFVVVKIIVINAL